jgi:hypothetical protein
MSEEIDNSEAPETAPLSIKQVFSSVLSAHLGARSREVRERDFSRGKAAHFFIAGLVYLAAIITGIIVLIHTIV